MHPGFSLLLKLQGLAAFTRLARSSLRRQTRRLARHWPWRKPANDEGLVDGPVDLNELLPAVDSCREQLLDFGRETDAEFTELARGLSDLTGRFSSIREQTESLDEVLHQRDKENILANAYQVYKSSVDLVHSSMGIALSEQQQMAQVEDALALACSVQDTFKRNNLLLRILTMSIRMEASRIDSENRAVFLNVAAAIAEIDDKIAQTTAAAFSRIEQVIEEARQERGALHGLEQELQSRAQQSIDRLQQELADYRQALGPCADLSCKIGELFAQTTPITQEILTSLQYQDIVRQQLEHVASGFEDISGHLREFGLAGNGGAKIELGFIHHAASVQQAHLKSSRADIEKAGTSASGGIKRLLVIGEQLISSFNDIEKAAQVIFGRSRISELFKHEIHQLALIADQSEKANEKISRLVERIDDVVRVFSREITSHEFEVKLVSLNAQIAAARLSSAEALNKLAEESSLASSANAAATEELTRQLQACLGKLQGIKKDADEFMRIVTQEKNDMEARAGVASGQLGQLGVRIGARATDVRKQFAEIYESQRELLANLRFGELVGNTYDAASLVCGKLRSASRDYALPEDLTEEGLRRLAAHQNRYTMESEAELHSNVLKKAPAKKAAPEKPSPAPAALSASPSPEIDRPAPTPTAGDSAPTPPPAAPADASGKNEDLGEGIELF